MSGVFLPTVGVLSDGAPPMRFGSFIPLVGCVVNLFLALFVLANSPRQAANRVYFFWGLSIAVWNLGQFFLFTTEEAVMALYWARFLWFGVVFIPTLLYHISLVIAGQPKRRHVWWLHGIAGALAISNLTPWFIKDVRLLGPAGLFPVPGPSGWYAVPGPGLWLFNLLFCLTFYSIYIVVKQRRRMPPLYRSRLDALIVAQSCMVLLGSNDLLPIIKIDFYPFTNSYVYPYGSIAAICYGIIIAYSVLQHHLLDIHVRLSRVAAQIVRFTFLTMTSLGLLLVATLIFPDQFSLAALLSSLAVFMISTIIASWVFPRLFGGPGVEKWERRILGDHFEYQDRIRAFIKAVPLHSDSSVLLSEVDQLLTVVFRFSKYWLVLRDDTEHSFYLASASPAQVPVPVPDIRMPSPVFTFFENRRPTYLPLGASSLAPAPRGLESEARAQLARFNAEFAFPLMVEDNLFGLLLVGTKNTGELMTATDLHLLVELTQQLSLVLNQIRLKDEVLRTQELELLGRMSRGMAHDLNNLLTPIWTLLQLASEGSTKEPFDDELLDVALRNIKTVRAYIREALFFSQHLRPDLQLGRLDVVVHQAVEVAQTNRKKNVEIVATTPGEVLVEMDEVLVQRLLANLISNAVDAAPSHSQIRVDLERLAKSEGARDWLRIRVIDQGEGIPKENLDRVLTPYFTTKNRGDEARGFGLGLAICRKIVALHGGKLSISSELRKGTTVQIDLPSRQIQVPQPEVAHAA